MIDKDLLLLNLKTFPHQPATCIFRTVEIDHILKSKVLPKTGHGLDLGCGDGRITRIIMEKSGSQWRLTGIDVDPEEVLLAKEVGIYEKIYVSDANPLKESANSLDFVFSNCVLEHINHLEPVLAEVSRVLKPKGKFIFTVPSAAFPRLLGGPGLFGGLATGAWDRSQYLKALDNRLAHLRYGDEHDWRLILEPCGLTLTHASYYLSRQELRRWELLSNITAGVLVRFSAGGQAPINIQRHFKIRQSNPSSWLVMIAYLTGFLATMGLRAEQKPDISNRQEKACLLGCATKSIT